MGRHSRHPDDASEWEEPDAEDGPLANEDPDESDMDSHDDPELVPCPYCGKLISEDTDICHLCGSFISKEDAHAPVPRWILIGVVICIAMCLLWIVLGLNSS